MKKVITLLALICVAAMLLAGCQSTPAEHTHTLIHNKAKAPTCVNNGILEHWYCPECNARFADEAATKEVTFADLEIEELGHKEGEDDGDCTTAVDCTVCGEIATAAKPHTPDEDDGDCTTAVDCTECDKIAVEAKADHEAAEDDGDCTTAVTCKSCDHVFVEAAAEHTPDADDGDCTTAVKCTECEKDAVEAKAAHVAGEDDGDCTTAVACTECEKNAVEAKAAHTDVNKDYKCDDCATMLPLKDGDQIVIVCRAHNKALSSLPSASGSYYQKGVDVTVTDGVLSGYADTEVWTVIVNDDGTYSFAQGGQNLGMQASYSSMSLGAVNDKWELVVAEDGAYMLKNVKRGSYIEWYSSKNNWSTYTTSKLNDPLFMLDFYGVG